MVEEWKKELKSMARRVKERANNGRHVGRRMAAPRPAKFLPIEKAAKLTLGYISVVAAY